MCGGNLEVQQGMNVCECEYCGSFQTVPTLDDEKKINLFTRAHRLRSACEFDKASGVYESIVAEFQEEAEAYWGLILCKYGIEYVDDPKTGKKIPTCHRSSFDNVLDDVNFEMVMEYSDPASRAVYREEAKAIEALRIGIIAVSSKEEPYDIFICYKETDALGERTIDSVIAQDVYDVLTEKGYRVFFSRITLEDKLGQEYEPYIFAALNSAKIMLVFGTDYEYYNAVWVKNEWSRFLHLIEKGERKTLIPCFKGIDAYDMPKEFARLQAQDMGKVGAIQDLVRGIGKILGTNLSTVRNDIPGVAKTEDSALIQRGNMALEDGDFKGAEGFFERALDADPSDAYAYLGKFLAYYGLSSLEDLSDKVCMLENSKEFRRAEQFADVKLAKILKDVRERNTIKLERLKVIDVIKKYSRKRAIAELDSTKRESYFQIMSLTTEGEKRARDTYINLLITGIVSQTEYSRLIERISIVKGIGTILSDYEIHAQSDMFIASSLKKYPRYDVTATLEELLACKCIEESENGYCWIGAKENRERLVREAEERRKKAEKQKAAYDAACQRFEEKIWNEASSKVDLISTEYDSRIQGIQREMDEKITVANRERGFIQNEISDLRSRQSSLGFFKGKEKKALQAQIDAAQKRWDAVLSPEQIQSHYQLMISKIASEKKGEVDKVLNEVRARYAAPKYEDFADKE